MMAGEVACVHCGINVATAERVMAAWPGMLMTPPSGRLTAEHLDANEDVDEEVAPAMSWRGSMAGDKSQVGLRPAAGSLLSGRNTCSR